MHGYYLSRIYPFLNPLAVQFPEGHSFQEVKARLQNLKAAIKKWEKTFTTQTGQKPTTAEIKENPGMLAMHIEYHQLKQMSTSLSMQSRSAPESDEIRRSSEAVSNSATGAHQAPSTSALVQHMDAVDALLRAQILHRACEEPQVQNAGALHDDDELLSLLQEVEQTQPRKRQRRRVAFRGILAPHHSDEDINPVSNIPCPVLIPELPALHPETQASLMKYGLFPFARGQEVPWDSTFFFPEQIDIDSQGDDTQQGKLMDSFYFYWFDNRLLPFFGRFE